MSGKPERGLQAGLPLCDFVNSKIIRNFAVRNCGSDVCTANVEFENNTSKNPSGHQFGRMAQGKGNCLIYITKRT
jgi:hypothetical protein